MVGHRGRRRWLHRVGMVAVFRGTNKEAQQAQEVTGPLLPSSIFVIMIRFQLVVGQLAHETSLGRCGYPGRLLVRA